MWRFDVLVKKVLINPPLFDQKRFDREMHCGPFYLFTKSLYEKIGPYDETFRIAGDYDWCTRAARLSGKLEKSNVPAGIFEKRAGTLSGGKNPLQEQENARVIQNINT
jgi:GT2 family glycosyltransferase